MPRRDGFPTNPEMLLDFSATAHRVFTTAYERTLEGHVSDAFQDKPLKYFFMHFRQDPVSRDNPVSSEELRVGIVTDDIAEQLPFNQSFLRQPEEWVQRYVNIAQAVGEVAISDSLVVAVEVPVEAINADYTLSYQDGNAHHVSSFQEWPSKQSIVSGKYFAEEALQYAESDELLLSIEERSRRMLTSNAIHDVDDRVILHRMALLQEPDLPLNGYEPKGFLEAFASKMFIAAMHRSELIEQMRARGASSYAMEREQKIYDKFNSALKRAQEILDRK
jgi:hypothetical protein